MLSPARSFEDIIAIVPAAGLGSRMQMSFPKQYLAIGDKTVIEHAIAALLAQPCIRQVIVALSPDDCWFDRLPVSQDERVRQVPGGRERADSVLAGLRLAGEVPWVLVHDAARPCLHQDDLLRLLALTAQSDIGGILAAPVRDTMKRAAADGAHIDQTVDRNNLWHALTPQLFPGRLLLSCLERALDAGAVITDEASALEYCGYRPLLVPGRADNIKVTRPEDLDLAAFYLTQLHKGEKV